jgi:leucyl-tRNA synthetase
MQQFLVILNPYAPHLAEELWQILGGEESIAKQPWPKWDSDVLVESSIEVPVQFNGKVKAKIRVAAEISKDDLLKAALQDPKVQTLLEGKTIVKQIVVPGRLVNLVVK